MAGEDGTTQRDLKVLDRLLGVAPRTDFFTAVGLLERVAAEGDAAEGGSIGGDGPVESETVRFKHDPSLAFRPGEISSIHEVGRRFEVTTSFLGLTGAASPLPMHFAEEVLHDQDDDGRRRDFFDLFHHRLLSLFYRLWVQHDVPRVYRSDGGDEWSRRLLALCGIDVAFEDPHHLTRSRLLRIGPLLASGSRSAKTLEKALNAVCSESLGRARARVEEFTGAWTLIDESLRMELGVRQSRLGISSVLGERCYHRAGTARVVLEPLDADSFERFLPEGDQFAVVAEVTGLVCQDPVDFDLELVLSRDAQHSCRLGAASASRLGVDSWLSSGERESRRLTVRLPTSNVRKAS